MFIHQKWTLAFLSLMYAMHSSWTLPSFSVRRTENCSSTQNTAKGMKRHYLDLTLYRKIMLQFTYLTKSGRLIGKSSPESLSWWYWRGEVTDFELFLDRTMLQKIAADLLDLNMTLKKQPENFKLHQPHPH